MALKIVEIHPADAPEALNTEWFILENTGENPFSTKNCTLSVTRKGGKKRIELGTLDPGFVLAPGDRMRVITGNPGRKAHGKPPEDKTGNYNLFLGDQVLRGAGTVLVFGLRSHTLATAEYDPDAKGGVAPVEE
ncbi:MAG TPA: hypothetical protein VK698_06935 [Kofleriaceae bacterium]|nr:hypothetical protein [Kofleriaceae bacterium]